MPRAIQSERPVDDHVVRYVTHLILPRDPVGTGWTVNTIGRQPLSPRYWENFSVR